MERPAAIQDASLEWFIPATAADDGVFHPVNQRTVL